MNQHPSQNQNNWKDYAVALGIIVVFFAGIIVFWLLIIKGDATQPPEPPPVVKNVVTCPPDNLSYGQVSKNVQLISNRINLYAKDGGFVNPQVVIAKTETSTSKFACGYLFIQAGTKTYGALQAWENVYVNPNGFGGHLNKESALSVNDGLEYSKYIYPLNKIQYWPGTGRQSLLTADWAALLNVSNNIKFDINLNTNDQSGFIDEITIAYKCWNPETGEENADCKLTSATVGK
jgi:hypothetical protein